VQWIVQCARALREISERRRLARVTTIDFVFHHDGEQIGDFRKAWKTACKLAGVPGRLFHDLCRCAARNLDKAGVSRRVAMEIMGRKSESIYNRYRIVDDSEKRVALKRMQEYLEHASSEPAEQAKLRTIPTTVQ
jgi:integrase